jgi:capsid protein
VIITTLCHPTWGYVIGQAIANGELPDDESWAEVSWTTPKSVTVDGGRDSANDREDLRIGLLSFAEIYNQRGMNFEEEAEIKAQNVRHLLDLSKTYGVPFETLSNLLINTAPGTVAQTSTEPQPDAETETSS